MIGLKHEKPLEVLDTEVVLGDFEIIDTADTRVAIATAFDMCIDEARNGDGVSIEQFELPNFDRTDVIVRKIISETPANKADLIDIIPMGEGQEVLERHIFVLKRIDKDNDKQTITTLFDVEHEEKEIRRAELYQELEINGVRVGRIIRLDESGQLVTSHIDGSSRSVPSTNPDKCGKDLTEIVAAIAAPVSEVMKHTTQEFDAVKLPPILTLPRNRLAKAAFVFGHPDSIERVA